MRNGFHYVAALSLALLAGSSQAASISLTPEGPLEVATGDVVTFSVAYDFIDFEFFFAGGFDLAYDASALELVSVVAPVIGDPTLFRPPTESPGLLEGWVFSRDGPPGPPVMLGSVSFLVLAGMGSGTEINLQQNQSFQFICDFLPSCFTPIEFGSATLTRVPLPGAVWLLIGGVISLAGLRRGN